MANSRAGVGGVSGVAGFTITLTRARVCGNRSPAYTAYTNGTPGRVAAMGMHPWVGVGALWGPLRGKIFSRGRPTGGRVRTNLPFLGQISF